MRATVGVRFGLVLAAALLALVLFGCLSYWNTARLISDARLVEHTLQVLDAIERSMAQLQEAETLQRGYLLTGSTRYLNDYRKRVRTVEGNLTAVRLLVVSPNQKRRMTTLEPLVRARIGRLEQGIRIRDEKGLEGASAFAASGVGKVLMDQIRTVVGDMKEEEGVLLEKRSLESAASARRALEAIVFGVLIAGALVVVVGWSITRSVTRPLQEAALIAERMAAGDLSMEVRKRRGGDEVSDLLSAFAHMIRFQREMAAVAERIAVGDLRAKVVPQSKRDMQGNAFASMTANLRQLTAEMAEAVTVLGTAAGQIASATSQLSAVAIETATAMTETAVTVTEVRQTAHAASQKALGVAERAQGIALVAQGGIRATEDTGSGMQLIQRQMETVGASIARLGEQTDAIGQIIAAVDGLASQSSLLSVNAAIEAAKAGEQGRGFAAVAKEIKSLAMASREATRQVRTILGDIQRAASEAASAAEQGVHAVASGVGQSAKAGSSIHALADGVEESARAAMQIAATSRQQLAGVDQMALAMESIGQASARNVTSARQLEASARDMEALGAKLKTLVARYQV